MTAHEHKRHFHKSARPAGYYSATAQRLHQDNNDKDARICLEKGLNIYPENATLWLEYGKILKGMSRDEDDKVLRCYETAHKLKPDNFSIRTHLAGFLTLKGAYERAEALYVSVYKAEENKLIILTAMGNHYQQRGMAELSLACFHRAANLPTGDQRARIRYHDAAARTKMEYTSDMGKMLDSRIQQVDFTCLSDRPGQSHRHS